MPLTIAVRCARPPDGGPRDAEELAITFDSPRLVIGRGEGADLRLPDPSVSQRHASLRARGAEWVLIDEGSSNGTFLDKVMLAPQSPRVLRAGEVVRVGRVWLQIRIDPGAVVTPRPAAAAKELALELVARALRAEGEDARPRVWVLEGPDAGKELRLDPRRTYVVGRGRESDLALEDADVSRRHVELSLRGDQVMVQDLGSRKNSMLGARQLEDQPAVWPPGEVLQLGSNRLALSHAAADALAELERSPDERMDPAEPVEPPPAESTPEGADEAKKDAIAPAPVSRPARPSREPAAPDEPRGWSLTDGAVLLLSLGVLLLSVAGLLWLLAR